jgi:hypothetical protein
MEEQALPTDGFAMLKMANTTAFFSVEGGSQIWPEPAGVGSEQ